MFRAKFVVLISFGFCSAILFPDVARSQNGYALLGISGALLTPTARIVPDARLSLGVGYLPAGFAVLRAPRFGDKIYSLTLGYLPFLETTWGILRSDHIGNRWGIGDRFAFFRFRLRRESARWPAMVLGLHDPFGIVGEAWAQHLCAAYAVISKTRAIFGHMWSWSFGYGVDWIPAAQHQLVGPFGSLAVRGWQPIDFILEYDTRNVNVGIRLRRNRYEVALALLGMQQLSGRLSASFSLLPNLTASNCP